MYTLVSQIFVALLVMAYLVLLLALAWRAVGGRLRFTLKKHIGLASVRPLRTFRTLGWRVKGLKSATSPKTRITGALHSARSFGRRP
jgi:hypothetical protein